MKSIEIIGIDEVGRGPIAGPVAVCAFRCSEDFFNKTHIKTPLRDSKKLTKLQREKWFVYLKECSKKGECTYKVSYVSPACIDKYGITHAIRKALKNSLSKVAILNDVSIYLDGGLKAPKKFTNQSTHIKGDELYPVISCASIMAKVSRDKVMTRHHKAYPLHGFDKHVGYGTRAHYIAIKKNGLTPLHRVTFLR